MAATRIIPIAHKVQGTGDRAQASSKERVSEILTRCKEALIQNWLTRTKKTTELHHLELSDQERTGHLPRLIDDLVVRLATPKVPDKDSDAVASPAAVAHGKLRRRQGYSSAMLIHESRILQVTIFGILHENLSALDFGLLLPDVMIIADEVESQLTQTMESFTNEAPTSPKTHFTTQE